MPGDQATSHPAQPGQTSTWLTAKPETEPCPSPVSSNSYHPSIAKCEHDPSYMSLHLPVSGLRWD